MRRRQPGVAHGEVMPEAEGMKPRGASFELQETFTHRSLLLELSSHDDSSDPAVTGKHEQVRSEFTDASVGQHSLVTVVIRVPVR
jgi:hypothetical protein